MSIKKAQNAKPTKKKVVLAYGKKIRKTGEIIDIHFRKEHFLGTSACHYDWDIVRVSIREVTK